ncbi:TetR/AcrR family transcriptional regulator [Spongiibacter sp. KMU-166]|uniref:TetR/AcrR family transcriptional regulator n=1 Tax=Spongiibacter thalassae TaxID=2721624 RepID=A0ABX1G9T9_9GAMM|nr:TetR/AcrR family transcriptional regulator [Spongiibacter thalassae]NKI15925.1 TetR/AcrR family transcriptional regulator [Spongiibacter thalassae]
MPAPEKRRTQAERIEATEEAMYMAAIKLIARDGPNKMTLASLGKEAGVSPGLVNHRFGSKSNLLQATCMRVLEEWTNMLRESAVGHSDSCIETLKSMSRFYLDSVAKRSELVLAQSRLMSEGRSLIPELLTTFRKYNRQISDMIVELLESGQKAGEVKTDVDPRAFSYTFIGMLRGVGSLHLIDNTVDVDAAFDMIANTCTQVLSVKA